MPHVVSPVAYVAQLLLVEVISESMSLVILPVADIKLLVVEEALALLAVSGILFPEAVVLVARCLFSIGADVSSLAISLLHCVDIPFKSISICILYPYNIPVLLLFTTLHP